MKIKNLVFGFKGTVEKLFQELDIQFQKDNITSIMGPSGCGKSTLLDLILGLKKPDSGCVERGANIKEIAVLFQGDNLFPWLTVSENIGLLDTFQSLKQDQMKLGIEQLLKKVGLENFANYYPNSLSGGMKQKAALARCMAFEPKILLLDEAFSSLDSITRERLHLLIMQLKKELGLTIINVTHDIDEAIFISDEIKIFNNGNPSAIVNSITIDREGRTHEVFSNSMDFLEYKQKIKLSLSSGL